MCAVGKVQIKQADLVADLTVILVVIQFLAVAAPALIRLCMFKLSLIQCDTTAAATWCVRLLLTALQV